VVYVCCSPRIVAQSPEDRGFEHGMNLVDRNIPRYTPALVCHVVAATPIAKQVRSNSLATRPRYHKYRPRVPISWFLSMERWPWLVSSMSRSDEKRAREYTRGGRGTTRQWIHSAPQRCGDVDSLRGREPFLSWTEPGLTGEGDINVHREQADILDTRSQPFNPLACSVPGFNPLTIATLRLARH
jgi:hypothetical protein